jgi:cytochrome c biogenesis protein CcmG/thiol:disulfide interchange protein DsbE
VSEVAPATPHKRRRTFIGPFSARQVVGALLAIAIAAVVLTVITTPLGAISPVGLPQPRATAFLIGTPVEGLQPGQTAPELEADLGGGSTFQLADLDGRPIRLADLRGQPVWINFWASWCPPCQQETPVLRDLAERYEPRGLVVVAVNVQETVDRAREYAQQYGLDYVIGADVSAHILRRYRVFALPTQFFIAADGTIQAVVQGPLDEETAQRYIEAMLETSEPSSGSPS